MVDFGLPENSMTMILEEMNTILNLFSDALGDKRNPTPPIVALPEFLVAEEVASWYPSIVLYSMSTSAGKNDVLGLQ